eukprot:3951676-Pyramimonas_sp.AAC.1
MQLAIESFREACQEYFGDLLGQSDSGGAGAPRSQAESDPFDLGPALWGEDEDKSLFPEEDLGEVRQNDRLNSDPPTALETPGQDVRDESLSKAEPSSISFSIPDSSWRHHLVQ